MARAGRPAHRAGRPADRAGRPTDRDGRVELLRGTYLFQDLAPGDIEAIAALTVERRLARGQAAYRAGDPADRLYVVATGQVKECAVAEDGEEIVFEVLTRGGVVGEPGLFSAERDRMVELVALRDATLLAISRDDLLAIMRLHPPVMERMLEGLATMVRSEADDELALVSRRVRDRVALKLLELATTHGRREPGATRIRMSVSQSTIAAMAGASRENANRAIAALVAEGLVRLDGPELLVDPVGIVAGLGVVPPRHRRNRMAADRPKV